MFYFFRRFTFFTLGLTTIFFVHTLISYLFPFPFNQINAVYLALLWLVVYRNDTQMLWLALGATMLMDVFSSTQFGVLSAAVIVALLSVRRLFFVVFTNYSWYNILLLGLVGYIFYKILLYVSYVIVAVLGRSFSSIVLPNPYASLFEIGVNTAIFLCIYAVVSLFTPRKRYYHAF